MTLISVRAVMQGGLVALAASLTFSCAMQSGDAADGGEENVGSQQQALMLGYWSATLSNGAKANPGEEAWFDPNVKAGIPCEVYSSGDRWWHPGKWWQGQCRIQWGSGIYVSPTYRTLEVDPAYDALWYQTLGGEIPANTVVSSAGDLPICKAKMGGEWTLGKFWQGACWGEYGGQPYSVRPQSAPVLLLVYVTK